MLKSKKIIDKKCSVPGCENTKEISRFKGTDLYCNKHYNQLKRYGHILERTIYDLNEIILYDNYAEIILYNKQNEESARTKISLNQIDKVKNYKWCVSHNRVYHATRKEQFSLPRFLLNAQEGEEVDHINHDTLDNRDENIRLCAHQNNMQNTAIFPYPDNISGRIGVNWHKETEKWMARIRVNKKQKYLGSFDNLNDAIKAREEAEEKYFREFKNPDL